MTSYEGSSLTEIEAVLDGLTEATSAQVYDATLGYNARAVAAVAASRADAAGGASFPPEWTVGEDGSLVVQTDGSPFAVAITARGSGDIGDPSDFVFSAEDQNGNQILYLAGDGLFMQDVDNQQLLGVNTDGSFSFGGTTQQPGSIILGLSAWDFRLPALASEFNFQDHNGNSVLRVRDDGSVHIKTGTSLVADL